MPYILPGKRKGMIYIYIKCGFDCFLNFLLFSSRFWLFLFACFPVAFGGFLAL